MKRALIGFAISGVVTSILLIAVSLASQARIMWLGSIILVLILPPEYVSYVLWGFFAPDRHGEPSALVGHALHAVTTFLWIAGVFSPLLFGIRFGGLSRNRSQAAALGIGALAILLCIWRAAAGV